MSANECDGHGTFVREQLGPGGPYETSAGDCDGCPMCTMTQSAPYPHALQNLVNNLTYKRGWRFYLTSEDRGQDSAGLTLNIVIQCPNSYHPDKTIGVRHLMIVPAASYDERSWLRWLLDQVLLVERHEACEFFTIAGAKPYAPSHGPGNDPYLVREIGTEEDQRTNNRGHLNPPSDDTPTDPLGLHSGR